MTTISRSRVPKRWQTNPQRYRYLVAYCKMYDDYKQAADCIRHEYKSANSGGIAVNSTSQTSTVEKKAEKLHEMNKKISLIENCVSTAVRNKPYLFKAVLMSLTQNVPYDYLPTNVTRQTIASYRIYALILLEEKLF